MKPILVILQNMWVHNPERVKQMIVDGEIKYPGAGYRRRIIERALFAGCITGKRIMRTFHERLPLMTFDEASPEIAGKSSAVFPADHTHLSAVIAQVEPRVILTFGRIATVGIATVLEAQLSGIRHVRAPHPASRQGDILDVLRLARVELDRNLQELGIV